ncbi:phage major capsid protein [Actinomadura sp. 9N215]|uniref:phage major capsid protein n=1 Tax=Actinomadura sp. 9N215 TaxID=3375150 RepID=UPI0037BAF16B
MLEFLRARLKELLEQRAARKSELDEVLKAPSAEKRDLNEAEAAAFTEKRAAIQTLDTEIEEVRGRVEELEADEKREQAANELRAKYGAEKPAAPNEARKAGAQVNEPLTYQRGAGHSYFLDLARIEFNRGDGDGGLVEARERLRRHGDELRVEMPAREKRREEIARREMRGIDNLPEQYRASVFEKRVNPNRTDGQGGYFVPPLWLVDEYIDLPRYGRTTANLCRTMTLPSGTDSINLPKVATGTATGVQTADAGAVPSTDMTDTFVTAPVRTISGQQDVAIQLLDQSPISFDEVVFDDLIADYNMQLDLQVINGSGSSGQVTGILNTAGINSVTYTDATPTLPEMYPSFAQGASKVATGRKMPATAAVVIPSIWYWATAQLDTTNRPLITTLAAYNPAAVQDALASEGPVGMLALGLPVYLDGNVPSNLGAGTNETRVIEARFSDLYLWEGSMRTRVLQEVLSGTLQVRFQVYNYAAFMANRRPTSISVISGTGLIPTAGY